MNPKTWMVLLLLAPPLAPADGQWILEQCTLTYHVSHPLHQSEGVSHAARGKGVCRAGQCDFLIAAPVKSFESGDSNRDLHMLQVTRGAEYPMVSVRTRVPQSAVGSSAITADLEDPVRGQYCGIQASPIPGNDAREYGPHLGDGAGDSGGFQD